MKLVELKSVAVVITGFPFKSKFYGNKGTRTVRGENITEGKLRWDTIKCWNEPFEKKELYSLLANDVVIGMDGSKVGKNKARILESDLPLLLAQRVACVRSKENFDQIFLYYCINNDRFQDYVYRTQTGSSVPHISKTQIEEFQIPYTDLKSQKQIAKVLSDLDAKIEVNNKINQELEAMAKTLYDYWFVQFDFPDAHGKPYKSSGGKMVFNAELRREIPEGWLSGQLGDVGKVSMCKRVMKHETSLDEEIPFFKISTFGGEANTFISRDLFESYRKKYSYPKRGDILISAAGTIGKTVIFNGDLSYFQDSNIVWIDNDESKIPNCFLFYYYQTEPWVATGGSTIKRLYNDNIRSLRTILPNPDSLKCFSKIVNPRLDKKYQIESENKKLSELRDWLLPMLMNGQVRVGEVEQELGMVAEGGEKYGK